MPPHPHIEFKPFFSTKKKNRIVNNNSFSYQTLVLNFILGGSNGYPSAKKKKKKKEREANQEPKLSGIAK